MVERKDLDIVLSAVARGELSAEEAASRLAGLTTPNLSYARLDTQRQIRTGHPEVIYGEGKSANQIAGLLVHLRNAGQPGLVTRVDAAKAEFVRQELEDVQWHPVPRILYVPQKGLKIEPKGRIAVVCAGTSDLPVAEEAALVAECFGNRVDRLWDVGVAGIHRLMDRVEGLRQANVLIVVAGMEGALASVVAGLVDRPVIGVPTSVGYGVSLGGLSALLAMLTACAPGISVVNIDNGFGAAIQASLINRLAVAGQTRS